MVLTKDLGNYLGVPLIHGRVHNNHFDNILQKLQKKLNGWKANVLSLARRATLVQVVTFSIPVYMMQTIKIPKTVCDRIDILNRNFTWGQKKDKNIINLVRWNKVCKLKKFGGLCIRSCADNNRANQTKLGWRVLNENDPL